MAGSKKFAFSDAVSNAVRKAADSIIKLMEDVGKDWKKPWIGGANGGEPRNISNRKYEGAMNRLLLSVHAARKGEIPVYMTFKQAQEEGVKINKGAQSVPVFYWQRVKKDQEGKIVPEKQLAKMTEAEKDALKDSAFFKYSNVFNVADTNLKEIKPERYEQLKGEVKVAKDAEGMYKNAALDRMIEKQEWIVPIHTKMSNEAFYSPADDSITLPEKRQFKKGNNVEDVYLSGMEYYGTALHEMTHSTGTSTRLNRDMSGTFGDKSYAKEELVAEFTAAVVGKNLGFDKTIQENNAKYLNGWIGVLKQEPTFMIKIMSDMNHAAQMLQAEIAKQEVKLQNKEGKTAVDIQEQYARINAQYPYAVDTPQKRNIVERIKQADQIVADYNKNIENHYGKDFLMSKRAGEEIIPQEVYRNSANISRKEGEKLDFSFVERFGIADQVKVKEFEKVMNKIDQTLEEGKWWVNGIEVEMSKHYKEERANYDNLLVLLDKKGEWTEEKKDFIVGKVEEKREGFLNYIDAKFDQLEQYSGVYMQMKADEVIKEMDEKANRNEQLKSDLLGYLEEKFHTEVNVYGIHPDERKILESNIKTAKEFVLLHVDDLDFLEKAFKNPSLYERFHKQINDLSQDYSKIEKWEESFYLNGKDWKEKVEVEKEVSNIAMVHMKNGDWAVRAKVHGEDTGLMKVDRKDAITFLAIEDVHVKQIFGKDLVKSTLEAKANKVENSLNGSTKLKL